MNAQSSFSSALVCNPVSGQRVRTMSSHFTQESCHLSTSLRATPTSTPPLPATATCRRSSGLRSLASVEQITMTGDQGGDGRKDILLVGKAAVVLTACSMLFLASDQQSVATPHHRHQPHMGIPLPPSNHQSPNVPHTTVVAATSETSEQAITFAKDVMDQVTTKPEKHSDRIVDTTTASALANSSSTEYLDGRRVYDVSILDWRCFLPSFAFFGSHFPLFHLVVSLFDLYLADPSSSILHPVCFLVESILPSQTPC